MRQERERHQAETDLAELEEEVEKKREVCALNPRFNGEWSQRVAQDVERKREVRARQPDG